MNNNQVSLTSKVDKAFHEAVKAHIEKYKEFNPKLTISSYLKGLIEKDLNNKEKYFINVREVLQEEVARLNKESQEKDRIINEIKEKSKTKSARIEVLEEEFNESEKEVARITEEYDQKSKEARSLAKELKDTQEDLEVFRGPLFSRVWAAIKG